MKKNLFLIAACMTLASSALAATSSWTKTVLHSTVYSSGTYASTIFTPPSTVPNSATSITGVTYSSWNPCPNGNTQELVELCYTQQYGTSVYKCKSVTGVRNATVSDFNTLGARGMFTFCHTLTGGSYPATASSVSDIVTVNYSY